MGHEEQILSVSIFRELLAGFWDLAAVLPHLTIDPRTVEILSALYILNQVSIVK